ncbi:MAG: dihydrolipoyl dehydrogenase [Nitrospirae bacterium]|nr:dihydrolipoyl dehydrogenase [Nitrospirota bacterium]
MRLSVLGAGPGGYVAAIRAAQLGARVTVIEDSEVGGTCLNRGCIPTKTIIASTDLLARLRDLEDFGLELKGSVIPNLSRIVDRKNKVVSTLVKGIRGLFRNRDITLVQGRGVISSPGAITVTLKDGTEEIVPSDSIIIATGSRPAAIPSLSFDGTHILSSTDALDLRLIPKSMLIVGAGVVGCEFACIFRELGAEVTIVEMLPRAVATEDREISELLEKELKKRKIKLITNVRIEKTGIREDGIHAVLSDGKEIVTEKILVSIGRALNTDGIGLKETGIGTGPKGEIIVNRKMETSIPGIYAVGDVTGGMLLAHKASAEGIVAAMNIMGQNTEIDYSVVPAAIFTSPEIASVGFREEQAAEKGIRYRVGRFPFRALGKAHAMNEIAGMAKIITDEETDRIIGAHIIGPHASDLIAEAAVAMKAGLTARELAGTIHAHPTLAEAVMEAAEDVHQMAVHLPGNKEDRG